MLTILNDQSKFKPCNHDTSLSNLTKFQRSLYYLNSKKGIPNDVYEKIYPAATTTLSLYGLPKFHKTGIPLRPILSCSGSFNHECTRCLSLSLNNLRQHPTNTPDTFQFLAKLSEHNITNQIMVSYDVKSLFTNISTIYTTNLILDSIFSKGCTSWNGLNRNRLKKLITWCTQNTTFQFNKKFYQQLGCVAMGSPIGSRMADVIMKHVVDKALDLTPPSHRPNFFCRYVDDRFAAFPNPISIDIFLTNLNNIHSQIQFTKELDMHNSLTFLDVFIEKTNSGIKTSTYHKPTKTSLLTKYTRFSPLYYKRNLVNNLLQRSYYLQFLYCN